MEYLNISIRWIEAFFKWEGASNAIASLALIVSLFSLKKNISWKEKFNEYATNEANPKIILLSKTLKSIDNSLKQIFTPPIGEHVVVESLERFEDYNANKTLRSQIRHSLDIYANLEKSLLDDRVICTTILQNLKQLGRPLSSIHQDKLEKIFDHIMHIEADIRSYISLSYDLFDDSERVSGMRYSVHAIKKNEGMESLQCLIKKNREQFKQRTRTAQDLLSQTNYETKIFELFKG